MEKEIKSIIVFLDYYDEDCNVSQKKFTIKVNSPKYVGEKGIGWEKRLYSITFTLKIPDHIYNFMLGNEIPVNTMSSRNTKRVYGEHFYKTISAETLSAVCEAYWTLTQDYLWLKNINKAELKKVIFYSLDSFSNENKSEWNGVDIGKKNNLSYKYCVGYISMHKGAELRYNESKSFIVEYQNKPFYSLPYLDWSIEREIFFTSINASFKNIVSKIDSFKENISEDRIDLFITDGIRLLN